MGGAQVGQVIATARKRAGLSQAQLGVRCGYAQTTISRIERGRQQTNDVRVLRRLADQLGIPLYTIGLAPETVEESWALEVIARVEASDAGPATLEGMFAIADRLCRDYPSMAAPVLHERTRRHLEGALRLLDGRVTLAQHREVLVIAGWLALLAGCLEYDTGRRSQAECTRQVAQSLGHQAGHTEIVAWACEMSAWFARTQGNYKAAIRFARAGLAATRTHGVAVQLYAQEAKGWARLGDRRRVSASLERGRSLLETLARPEHPEHHFVVDSAKRDCYEMDCYRMVGDNSRAAKHAREVLRLHTNPDGSQRAPMRIAEAHLTLATVAAREGDLDTAVHDGLDALEGERQSLPSLLLAAGELAREIRTRYPGEEAGRDYAGRLQELRGRAGS